MFNIGKRIKYFGDIISYKYPRLRFVLKPIYRKLFAKRYYRMRHNSYLHHAFEALSRFNECMQANSIEYSLAYGTMLGAIREKGFIKHDVDIDVFIWEDYIDKDIKNFLRKYGFCQTRSMRVEDGKLGVEESYEYKSVSIDVYYIFHDQSMKYYICEFRPNKGYPTLPISMSESGGVKVLIEYLPFVKKYKLVPFEGLMLPVFENAEEILIACYGENYMVPDPGFKAKEVVFEGVKGTYSGIGN